VAGSGAALPARGVGEICPVGFFGFEGGGDQLVFADYFEWHEWGTSLKCPLIFSVQ